MAETPYKRTSQPLTAEWIALTPQDARAMRDAAERAAEIFDGIERRFLAESNDAADPDAALVAEEAARLRAAVRPFQKLLHGLVGGAR